MAKDRKYLINAIIKGMKGDFNDVIEWYKQIYTNEELLVKLLEKEPDPTGPVVTVLDIIKAGFYSKSSEISVWTCKLLSKMAVDFSKSSLAGTSWEWFIAENGGLMGLLHCYRKNHHLVAESTISLMCQFGEHCFVELFTHHLKNYAGDIAEYFQLLSVFMQPLSEYRLSRDQINTKGVFENWLDLACQKAEPANSDQNERAAALSFLVEAWLSFHAKIEESPHYADSIVKLLQRANRDRNKGMQIMSIALQFKLLDLFAVEKDPYAPIIYKTLTFALISNESNEEVREFMIKNFKLIFDTFRAIPIGILLDPLIKFIRNAEGNMFFYNLYDFDFFMTIASHPKLTIIHAVQTIDLLAKIMLQDSIYSQCACKPFYTIINKFKNETLLIQYLSKMIQVFFQV